MKRNFTATRPFLVAASLLLVGKPGGEAWAQQSPFGPPQRAVANRIEITATRLIKNADGSLVASGTVTVRPLAPRLGLTVTGDGARLNIRDGGGRLAATMAFDTSSQSVQVTDDGTVFTDKAGDRLTVKPYARPPVEPTLTLPGSRAPYNISPFTTPPDPFGMPNAVPRSGPSPGAPQGPSDPRFPYDEAHPHGSAVIVPCRGR